MRIERKKIQESEKVSYKVCYNDNWACRMRGTESDHPNQEVVCNSVGELLSLLEDLGIIYEDDEVIEKYNDGEVLTEKDIQCIIDRADEMDITGGDTVLFSIEIMKGGRLVKTYATDWDPEEFEIDEDFEDEPDFKFLGTYEGLDINVDLAAVKEDPVLENAIEEQPFEEIAVKCLSVLKQREPLDYKGIGTVYLAAGYQDADGSNKLKLIYSDAFGDTQEAVIKL